jgi:LacI family transcriptional regulator
MYADNTYAEETFRNLSHRRIDGLILTPSYIYQSKEAKNTLNWLIKRQFPIVEITDHGEPTYEVDRVSADYQDITYEVMSHLISLQHKRIGVIFGVPIPELGMDRLIAYQESLQAAGLPIDPDLIARTGPTIEDGYHATRQLLELPARPTALLAINDILAIGALRAINDLNLSVPQDVSLVGYDDIPMAKFLVPRLSSVSKDGEKMGREAMRLLLARLENPDRPRQEIRLSARFINRESIAAAPF